MKYFLLITLGMNFVTGQIPLPEHPRPDFKRPQWINLNGAWEFKFDSNNNGFIKVFLETTGEGGMAIYGKDFGRYPFGPSLVIIKKK